MQSEEMKRVTSGLTQPVDWLEISEKENQRDTGIETLLHGYLRVNDSTKVLHKARE